MLVSLIYLQMNLKSKAYKILKIISNRNNYLEIFKKSYYGYSGIKKTITEVREIFDRKLGFSDKAKPNNF